MSYSVHPESVDAEVEPELERLLQLLHHEGVPHVEVGLALVELVEVDGFALGLVLPGGTAKHGFLEKVTFL